MAHKKLVHGLAAASIYALTLGAAPSAHAVVTYATDSSVVDNIPGLTGFATTGAMMDGMSVSAFFSTGFSQTLAWADTGPNSGGVTGTGWSLSLSGDTFSSSWNFLMGPNSGQITQLVLNGGTGFTVFDRSQPSPGTAGSASGLDFVFADTAINALVTYSNPVAIIPNAPVGDLWNVVTVNFGTTGPRTSFTFSQDTDNDARITTTVPEPATLGLLGLGLGCVLMTRRRRRTFS